MSIVTKKARKGLSVATALGLAAGLLTGFVAPANAVGSDSIAAAPSLGLRATQSYDEVSYDGDGFVNGGTSLAHLKLSTLNRDVFLPTADTITQTESGYCVKNNGALAPSSRQTDEATCEAGGSFTWIPGTTSTVVTGVINNLILVSTPASSTEVVTDFVLDNVQISSDTKTVEADLYFTDGGHNAFSKSGSYTFEASSVLGVKKQFTIVVGGDVKSAVFTPEYNPAPAGEAMEWTLALTDAAGAKTSLLSSESIDVNFKVSGELLVQNFCTACGFVLDTEDGLLKASPVNPGAGTYLLTATVQAATDVDSNTVTLVVKDVSAAGAVKVVEKTGVVAGTDAATIRTDVKAVEYKYSDTDGADAAGEFVWFNVYNEGGTLTSDDLTVVTEGKWLQLGADGTKTISVTNGADTIVAGMTYAVYTNNSSNEVTATYRAAGYQPTIDMVDSSGWADWANEYGHNAYGKSFVYGSTFTVKLKVEDIFGAPLKNTKVDGLDWYSDADFATWDNSELTDANGQVSFTLVNQDTATSVSGNEEWSGWSFVLPEVAGEDDFTLEAQIVRSVAPAAMNVLADGQTKAAFNDAAHVNDVDTHDSLTSDNVAFTWNLVNADNIPLTGVPVTVTTTAGGYVAFDNEAAIADMTAGSKAFPARAYAWDGAYATSTKTGTVTYTVSSGSLSEAFTLTYENHVTDARYITAAEATASVISGQYKTVTFTVTDRFGNPVKGVTVDISETGVGRLANGTSSVTLDTTAAGVVSVDVVSGAEEVGLETVTADVDEAGTQIADKAGKVGADVVTGVTAGVGTASTAVTYAQPVLPEASVKIGTLKGKIIVKVLNASDKAVAVFVGGKLVTSFVAGSNYVVKHIKSSKGKKAVTVRIYQANILVKRIVTVK